MKDVRDRSEEREPLDNRDRERDDDRKGGQSPLDNRMNGVPYVDFHPYELPVRKRNSN